MDFFLFIKYFKTVSEVFRFFFSFNASFSERFPENSSRFYSNVGHYKEEFECSFHSRKYW